LRISSIATLLSFTGIVTGAYLNGIEKSRYATYGSIMYAVAAVVVGMPLVAIFGLYGAAFSWVVAAATITGTNLYYIRKVKKSASAPDQQDEAQHAPLPFVAPAREARKQHIAPAA
jgi:O-antigen/teichoic acid export membrane protein